MVIQHARWRRNVQATGHAALLALAMFFTLSSGVASQTPEVRVSNIRRAFHNGEHNAFTDLVRFRDRFYLAFRSCPDGHGIHASASIIILSSDDAQNWREVHQFSVEKRDTRDPHFLVFRDRLFVYTGTWYCGDKPMRPEEYTLNMHLGYAAWSPDGDQWHGPVMLEGTFGHYIWRANTFNGKAYLCGRRNKDFTVTPRTQRELTQSAMLESDDGLVWHTRALFQESNGDETAFHFEPDGAIVAVARRGRGRAQLCRSRPPYTHWDRREMDRYIGGPLLAKWGPRYVVGGRNRIDNPKTSMCWLVDDELHEFAELPSAGDNSYPGFVPLSPTRALMSWYSSHETDEQGSVITAIYLADLEVVE